MKAKRIENSERTFYDTKTTLRRWGNSQGIRLPKDLLKRINWKENDELCMSIYDGKVIIEKVNKPKYLNLKERLEAFYGKPIDEIFVESVQEVDTGEPVGMLYSKRSALQTS